MVSFAEKSGKTAGKSGMDTPKLQADFQSYFLKVKEMNTQAVIGPSGRVVLLNQASTSVSQSAHLLYFVEVS